MDEYTTVTISNRLTRADWGLELPEYRVIMALLNVVYTDNHLDLHNYIAIDVIKYAETYGLSASTTYRDFKELLLQGMARKCILREGTEVTIWNYIRSIRYNDDGSYNLEVMFESNLAALLIPDKQKGNYTKLHLRRGRHYSSIYSTILHRILRERSFTGVCILSLEELREYLNIPAEEYKAYSNFNLRVLKPTITELNSITEMGINYSKYNAGKATTHIKFTIGEKNFSKEKAKKERMKRLGITDET